MIYTKRRTTLRHRPLTSLKTSAISALQRGLTYTVITRAGISVGTVMVLNKLVPLLVKDLHVF